MSAESISGPIASNARHASREAESRATPRDSGSKPGNADGSFQGQHWLEGREAINRAILEAAVDAIICIDEHGIIESINPAAERIFGYTEGELLGKNISMLMPNPYAAEHDGYIANYLKTGIKK